MIIEKERLLFRPGASESQGIDKLGDSEPEDTRDPDQGTSLLTLRIKNIKVMCSSYSGQEGRKMI
jgi:hypothetical protein